MLVAERPGEHPALFVAEELGVTTIKRGDGDSMVIIF
jgi:hypothetical protein